MGVAATLPEISEWTLCGNEMLFKFIFEDNYGSFLFQGYW